VFDAGRVLAVEKLEERFGKGDGDFRLEPRNFSPSGDAMVRLDLDVRLGPDWKPAETGDFDRGRAIGDIGGRVFFLCQGVIEKQSPRGGGPQRGDQFTASQTGSVAVIRHVAVFPM
jgi:hypothetical protein